MKRLIALLLVAMLLLSGCQMADPGPAEPDQPVITTPRGTPIVAPEGDSLEITDSLRRFYFDFCRDYAVGFLPAWNYLEGQRPNINDLKRYACIVMKDELYWADDAVGTLPGDRVEKLSQDRFDFSLGLTAEDQVEYRSTVSSINAYEFQTYSNGKDRQSASFCRLLEYRTAQAEGKTVYSVKMEEYPDYYWIGVNAGLNTQKGILGPSEQASYDLMQKNGMTYFEAMKELTLNGKLKELGSNTRILEFTYMDNGMGEPIFLAFSIE